MLLMQDARLIGNQSSLGRGASVYVLEKYHNVQ
jgi:hypothetical protein